MSTKSSFVKFRRKPTPCVIAKSNAAPKTIKDKHDQVLQKTTEMTSVTLDSQDALRACQALIFPSPEPEGRPILRAKQNDPPTPPESPITFANLKKPFACVLCPFSSAQETLLFRHVKYIHEKHTLPTFYCQECQYSCVRKDLIRNHIMVIHQNFYPFKCSGCHFAHLKGSGVRKHLAKMLPGCHGGGVVRIKRDETKFAINYDRLLVPNPDINYSERHRKNANAPSQMSPESKKEASLIIKLEQDAELNVDDGLEVKEEPKVDFASKIEVEVDVEMDVDVVGDFSDDLDDSGLVGFGDDLSEYVDGFQCPFCSFHCDSQLEMGDHVTAMHDEE